MSREKYKIIFLACLLFTSCAEENPKVSIGETIKVSAQVPDESLDLDYIWEITNMPNDSKLINTDIEPGKQVHSVEFKPDVPGRYNLEVSVFQYNDEISVESFSFEVVENDIKRESNSSEEIRENDVKELLVENNEPNWFESQELEQVLAESEKIKISHTNQKNDEQVINESPPLSSGSKPLPKSVETEKKQKSRDKRGASIPYDENRYTIQVGSKKELADAKTIAAKLIDNGYDAYIQKAVFEETNEVWYRIRVGSYDKQETATAVAKSLSKSQKEPAWVDFVRYEY